MGSVDQRIVEMQFDNKQFESGVKTTMGTLDKLKSALRFDGATKGLNNISKSAKNVDLNSINAAVNTLTQRFSAFGIMGMEVLRNLTNTAIDFGKKLATSVIDPVVSGGVRRAQNIEQAHFMLQGLLGDEEQVQAIMQDAMDSVDGTAYAYDSAAKAAAQFAATGMRSGEQMQKTLRAITGVAAMTNAEYEEISRIFTTVAGNGRVMGDQLLQLSSRGLNAAATIAEYMGITEQEVREMVSEGKISFETFALAMDDAFGEHAKKANETFTGAMSNIRAALARIGADFVSPMIVQNGPLVQALNAIREKVNEIRKATGPIAKIVTKLANNWLTKMVDVIKEIDVSGIHGLRLALYSIITQVRKLHLVENAFIGIQNIVEALSGVLGMLKEAFKAVFPNTFIETLAKIVEQFRLFTDELLALSNAASGSVFQSNLINTFKGFFSVLDIGKQVLTAIWRVFTSLIDPLKDVGTSVSGVTSKLAQFFIDMASYLRQNDSIYKGLKTVADYAVKIIGKVVSGVKSVIETIESIIRKFKSARSGFQDARDEIANTSLHIPTFEEALALIEKVKEKVVAFKDLVLSIRDTIVSKVEEIVRKVRAASGNWTDAREGASFDFNFSPLSLFLTVLTKVSEKLIEFGKTAKNVILILYRFYTKHIKPILDTLGDAATTAIVNIIVFFGRLKNKVEPLSAVFDRAKESVKNFFKAFSKDETGDAEEKLSIFERIANIFKKVAQVLSPVVAAIKRVLGTLFGSLLDAFSNFDLEHALNAGVFVLLLTWFEKLKINIEVLRGKLDIIKGKLDIIGTLNTLKGTLIAFTKDIKADALRKVAISVAIFAASLIALSGVEPKKMAVGLAGLEALISNVLLIFAALDHFTGMSNYKPKEGIPMFQVIKESINNFVAGMQANQIGSAMLKIAGAILLLAIAVKKLSDLSWEELAKGLTVVTILLAEMVGTSILISKLGGKNFAKATAGIIAYAIALRVIAGAVKSLGKQNDTVLAKGLLSVTILLGEMVLVAKMLSGSEAGLLAAGLAMIPFALGIRILGGAIKKMGSMSWEEIGKGLLVLAAALTAITAAIMFMPATLPLIGIGFLAIAAGLLVMSKALKTMGGMSWEEIGKSMLVLAGALTILVVAVTLMVLAIPGAAALVIITAALALLTPVLVALGAMPIENIGKSLLMLAGVFGVLGLAAFAFQKLNLIPTLLGLSVAIALLGVGTLAAGAGLVMLATGITAVAGSGALAAQAFVTYLQTIIGGILELIPIIITKIGEGIVAVLELFANNTAAFIGVFTTIGTAILEALNTLIPKIVEVGMNIIVALLTGVAQNIKQVTVLAATIIVEFILGIAEMLPVIIDAGIQLITGFFNGLAEGIRTNTPMILYSIKNLISSIIEFAISALQELVGLIPIVGDDLSKKLEDAKTKVRDKLAPEDFEKMTSEAAEGARKGLDGILHGGASGPTSFDIAAEGGDQYAKGFASKQKTVEQTTSGLAGGALGGLGQILHGGEEGGSFGIGEEGAFQFNEGIFSQQQLIDQTTSEMGAEALGNFDISTLASETGEVDVSALAGGMLAGEPQVDEAANSVKNTALSNLDFYDGAYEAGKFATIGLANGIRENMNHAGTAMYEVGSHVLASLYGSLQESSPSRATMKAGEYASEGLAIGIRNLLGMVGKSGEELGQEALNPIETAIDTIKSLFDLDADYTPTITPVLDLSNIQNGIGVMNGLWANRSIGLSGINGSYMQGRLGAMQVTGTNTDVQMFNLVSQLRDDVNTLGARMQNMQMVLDTGEFVGATTSNYSEQFAINARRVR